MSFDLRLPSVTATRDTERINQLLSFVHQLVQELNWALNSIETNGSTASEGKTADTESYYSSLLSDIKGLNEELSDFKLYIRKGRLDDGQIGVSIGYRINGTFNPIATFTNEEISLEAYVANNSGYAGTLRPYVTDDPLSYATDCANGITHVTVGDCIYDIYKNADYILVTKNDLASGSVTRNHYADGAWSGWN